MAEDEEQEKRGFKVEDRRRFSETGDVRPGHQEEATPPAAETVAPAAFAAPAAEPVHEHHSFMELNFSTFLLSLTTQALAHLGEIPDPVTQQVHVDLGAAKQMIDILGMLKEKTKGNLDVAESELLENALYDLRLRYVERARGGAQRT